MLYILVYLLYQQKLQVISGSLSPRHGASSGSDWETASNMEGGCEYID
jgi:hypothetical protein